jgi:acyl-CoA dehydrogenase
VTETATQTENEAQAFALTPDQEALLEQVRRLGREVFLPLAEAGEPARLNRPLVAALGAEGVLPTIFPRSVGGRQPEDVSATELCVVREGLARECVAAETAVALQGLGSYPILHGGSEEVVQRWLPGVARGDVVAAFALTEPNAGSDAGALELRAEPVDGGYRLTGEKLYISNAPEADVYTVFARTTPDAGSRGVSAFAVAGDAPGISGRHLEMVAMSHAIGHLVFDGVFVSNEELLGEANRGFRLAMRTLGLFRPSVGAAAIGMAAAALEAAVARAAARTAFGAPLRTFQGVSHRLADMATQLEAARLLVYSAAAAYDAQRAPDVKRAAMAKLFATETAQVVIDAAIQVHGASGLVAGHLLESLYREIRALRIYEGTSEIQREIIARALFEGSGPAA